MQKRAYPAVDLMGILVIALLSLSVHALASDDLNTVYCSQRPIAQQKATVNGVLVSGPSRIDERIWYLLYFNRIETVEDYVSWLRKNVAYVRDEGRDVWSTPQDTLTRRSGDCDDFTFLNAAVLRMMGFEPKTLGIRQAFRYHAVCAFEKGGHIYWIDNDKLRKTPARSLKGFAGFLFKKYNCSCVTSLDFGAGTDEVLFVRNKRGVNGRAALAGTRITK